MPDARITIEGRVAGDVRYGNVNGKDVANLRILAGRSKKNDNGEWENLSTTAYDCAFWAEHSHLVNALNPQRGDSVEVVGAITKLEAYNGQNGESLSAKVTGAGIKVFPKQQQSGGGNFGGQQSQQGGGWGNQQPSSGWGQNPQQGQQGGTDEPPF
ncbi:single-stranded DNA-binding protein [Brevibacterium sediminis]|uniref:single-stranded DNA-binding protein n=1 Tax=Brevibacterium sediminis TaxID=1857024 RepID=UPI00367183DD